MGSVIDYIECPHCKKQDAYDDFYYKTGEEFIWCPDCGYSYKFAFKRDEAGEYIVKDASQPKSLTNLLIDEIELKNPWCAVEYQQSGSMASACSSLETENDEIVFREFIAHNASKLIMAKISKYINGEHTVEYLLGKEDNEKIEEHI